MTGHRDRAVRCAALARECGVAVVEMAVLGTVVFALLIQLLVVLASAQRAAFATAAAAREAARAVVLSDSDGAAAARAAAVVEQAARNHGLDPASLHVSVDGAVVRGGLVAVTVRTEVAVVRLPLAGVVWPGLAIPVETTARAHVDQYRRFDATQ